MIMGDTEGVDDLFAQCKEYIQPLEERLISLREKMAQLKV
jgi:hypothetical protein